MLDFIPASLRERLGDERAARLEELVLLTERVLLRVYKMDAKDHDPDIGDNANLFGQKIWHHGWFALEQELKEWDEVTVTREDNSFRIRIWMLTIAVYKVGNVESESIFDVDFNGSTTKKGYAERNAQQLRLFSPDAFTEPEDEHSFKLNDIWIAHFGNPRDQFVKLYVGAPARNEATNNKWAWQRRVDSPEGGARTRQPHEPQPFDQRPEPAVDLELDEAAEENAAGGE